MAQGNTHDSSMAAAADPGVERAPGRRSPWTRIVFVLLLIVVVVGMAVLLRARSRASTAAAALAASAAAHHVVPVLTVRVEQRDIPVWMEGLGNVAAFYTVTVRTQVSGPIVKVLFKEGQHVKKGSLLLQIDPRPFAIQLESARAALARDEANLKNSRLNLDRYKTLAAQKLIAVQQETDQQAAVDQLVATVMADRAQVDTAKLNLDYAKIKSPIDGVTGVRLVDPGNFVQPSDASGLVVVTQLDPIAVLFTLPEDDLPAIKAGMAGGTLDVQALSRDGDKLLGVGHLSVIDNQINEATATARLKALFDTPSQALWPNQFVKARLRTSVIKNAIVVPAAVVQHGPQGTFAYVAGPDSTAEFRPVTVSGTQGSLAIIAKGLRPGEQVVIEGQAQLRPGAPIAPKAAPVTPADVAGTAP
ncbi:MAG: efflux RND transporter periplasmic adaptor subunit [Polyangiaceae bacterium]